MRSSMTKTNYLLCSGDYCPIRWTCRRFNEWLNSVDDEADEIEPDYHDGECYAFEPKEYYGG